MNQSKLLVTLALITISSVINCGYPASNQVIAAPANTVSKDFLFFWDRFKDALRKNDKNALADMTKFPYMDNITDKKLDKAAFIANSESIFSASTRKCLLREKPVADKDSFMLFCGENIYIFVKDQNTYKFSEIGVND